MSSFVFICFPALRTHPNSVNDTGVCLCVAQSRSHRISTRLRSYIGFLPVRHTLPNTTHFALAALQHAGMVGPLITQNVDGLHHAALRHARLEAEVDAHILELHGSIFVSPSLSWHCCFGIPDRASVEIRKCIVDTGTSTPARCFRSGLDKQTRIGTRTLWSSSARARGPRRIPMAM